MNARRIFTQLDRGSAGYLQLSREAIDRILEATAGCPRSAVLDRASAGALLQFVFNDLMPAAFFGSQPPAKRLQSIKRAADRVQRARDDVEKGEREAQLRHQLLKLSYLAFPPKPDPSNLDRLCRWLDEEQEAKRGGGRPPNDWAAQADIKLLAAYELIFGRSASSALDGPTMRFVRSFLQEGRAELRRHTFSPKEDHLRIAAPWDCGDNETLRTRLRNALRARDKRIDQLPGLPLAEGVYDQIAAYKTMFKALVWGNTGSSVSS